MISRRLLLTSLVVVLIASGGFVAARVLAPSGGRLSATEAYDLASRGEIRIVDVRTEREWRETGMPMGARGASIHQPGGREAFIADALEAVGGDRSRPIATIATTGVRSTRAQAWLTEAGFTQVFNVKEGMFGRVDETGDAPGWLNRGLPLARYPQ
jgi:rhodanese-related sulfurtransferase